jgi:hypothetical protein
MKDDGIEELEQRLASLKLDGPPKEFRGEVLAGVHRELAAARWDRRLARAAVGLLAVGVGMNLAIGLRAGGSMSGNRQVAGGPSRESLVQVAVTVAEATDAETGRRFARQLAAMSGLSLSSEQSAAIDAAVKQHSRPTVSDGKDG